MKLVVAVGNIGLAPKMEDLARCEGTGRDGELAGEANTTVWGGAACSDDEAGGSSHRRASYDASAVAGSKLQQA
jgi:hypothetical protein